LQAQKFEGLGGKLTCGGAASRPRHLAIAAVHVLCSENLIITEDLKQNPLIANFSLDFSANAIYLDNV